MNYRLSPSLPSFLHHQAKLHLDEHPGDYAGAMEFLPDGHGMKSVLKVRMVGLFSESAELEV